MGNRQGLPLCMQSTLFCRADLVALPVGMHPQSTRFRHQPAFCGTVIGYVTVTYSVAVTMAASSHRCGGYIDHTETTIAILAYPVGKDESGEAFSNG